MQASNAPNACRAGKPWTCMQFTESGFADGPDGRELGAVAKTRSLGRLPDTRDRSYQGGDRNCGRDLGIRLQTLRQGMLRCVRIERRPKQKL